MNAQKTKTFTTVSSAPHHLLSRRSSSMMPSETLRRKTYTFGNTMKTKCVDCRESPSPLRTILLMLLQLNGWQKLDQTDTGLCLSWPGKGIISGGSMDSTSRNLKLELSQQFGTKRKIRSSWSFNSRKTVKSLSSRLILACNLKIASVHCMMLIATHHLTH